MIYMQYKVHAHIIVLPIMYSDFGTQAVRISEIKSGVWTK